MGDNGDPESSERELAGRWRVAPGAGAEEVGVLIFSRRHGARLELDAALPGAPVAGPVTILGTTTGGRRVTLLRAFDRSGHRDSWESTTMATDVWLPQGRATAVTDFHLRSRMLRTWADVEEPLTATIPIGTLTLAAGDPAEFRVAIAREAVPASTSATPTTPVTIGDAWRGAVRPLLHFVTLCAGGSDSIDRLEFTSAETGERFGLLASPWMTRSEPHDAHARPGAPSPTLPIGELPGGFAAAVARWFRLHETAGQALNDYFAVRSEPAMTREDAFYRTVRSLEVLHTELYDAPRIPEEEFRRIRMKIKDALDGEPERAFILSRLSHADEASLRDRLVGLVATTGPRLQQLVADRHQFISTVIEARDAMTHAAEPEDQPDDDVLADARVVLELVMRSVLLRELGVPRGDLDALVRTP